jgi:ABC-type phosphate transport system substrate-binding protein
MAKHVLTWALGLLLFGASAAWAEDIVVVVNSQASVSSLTEQDVKDIYLGETTYWGDTRITAVGYQDGTTIQGSFLDKVMKTSENVYKTYWIKRIFREGGVPPSKAGSPDEALRTVGNNAGGITYVPASAMAGASGVKEVFRVTN